MFCSFLFVKNLWKISHSTFLFFLFNLCTDKHVYRKVSSHLFFKPHHQTQIPRRIREKCIFHQIAGLHFIIFPFGVNHRATPQNHWTKKTVKKLDLWEKTALDKIAWIKTWFLWTLKVVRLMDLIDLDCHKLISLISEILIKIWHWLI